MESLLQRADHWVTILSGFFVTILAIITLVLTIKDRQKTIAINELKTQSRELKKLYLLQIQPRFVASRGSSGRIRFKNIGADCCKLAITIQKINNNTDIKNPFHKVENFWSSQDEKVVVVDTEYNYLFEFEDIQGNKYSQTLYGTNLKFSNLKILE